MPTVACVLLALFTVSFAQRPDFTHHAVLDPNGNFQLNWNPTANGSDYFTFECVVATRGWIGLGFSSNGAMAAADMVIAWVDASGNLQISDRHGPAQGNGYPPVDSKQDYELVSGRKNNTHTIITFRRKQDTCDPQDWKITSDTTRLIWAYNDQVPTSADDISKHTERGVKSVQLVNPQTKDGMSAILADPSTVTYDFRLTSVTLPTEKRTLYWCEIMELPKWNKHHIIANRMLVQKGNERYVHHLVMYGCGEEDMSEHLGKPAACFDDMGVFNPMHKCSSYRAIWAVGGEDFVYPSNMGAPFFEDPKQRFVLLEMHYDNPDLKPGITDNSAFRLYLTEKLRPVETGRITIGLPVSPVWITIPPKQQRFTTYVYCPGKCTSRMTEPINVFTGLLHTHLLGVAMRVRVIRNGEEIKSDMRDDHYDFNYQTPVYLSKPLVIMPGDDIIVECTYGSMDRDTMAYGGYGSDNEMCLALLEYYPKRNLTSENCMSFVDPKNLTEILGLKKDQVSLGSDGVLSENVVTVMNKNQQNVTIADWYKNDLKVTNEMVTKLQNYMKNSPQAVFCNLQGKDDEGGNVTDVTFFQIDGPIENNRPYVEPPTVCSASTGSSLAATTQPTQTTTNHGASKVFSEVVHEYIDVIRKFILSRVESSDG
uniref:DOMON domain-containing protein n=1 Tax=Plectus sambesii TaxID=2011161 RepID=A0A914UTA6_9BILA